MKDGLEPLELFISYSHKDDRWRVKLDSHLALLKRQNVFDVWHDRRIGAGREWAGEINEALESASVVLLLVSSDFLASDYCYDLEMKRALQRHDQGAARVVPVILRTCDWQSSDFGRLQAVPRDGRPIASHSDTDAAMTQVAVALRKVAEEIRFADTSLSTVPFNRLASIASVVKSSVVEGSAMPASAATPDSEGPPGNEAAGEPSTESPAVQTTRKLKIGAVKVWFLEVGPFELEWPVNLRTTRLFIWLAAVPFAFALIAAIPYAFVVKPQLDEAHDLMRRADYAGATKALEALQPWAAALPFVKSLSAQAAFGSRISRGEQIRELSPELDALRKGYPDAPDVLVFMGLKSYYVDQDADRAMRQFTEAAMRDPAHVEAHFLAAGRHIDLAYVALGQGNEAKAKLESNEAQDLIGRALKESSFAESMPSYANEIADLHELEGDTPGAYRGYARLASLHALSALQSAMVSWRLPGGDPAHREGLEVVEAAISQVERMPGDTAAIEGWSFRTSPTGLVDVHSATEKLCVLDWAQEISKSLLSMDDIPGSSGSANKSALAQPPARCGDDAIAARVREIVCVQVLTALDRLPRADPGRESLEDSRANRLRCAGDLRALPALPASGVAAQPTGLHTRSRDHHDVEPA